MFEQRTKYTARRKQIWEALHPRETGGRSLPTCLSDGRASGPQHEQGFAASTAAITGEAKRTINQHLARADALGDDVERITGTSLDKGVELVAPMKADFLNVADSINSLDATNQTMQPAPVALINSSVQLKVSIEKMKPPVKLPALDLFGAPEQATKRTNDRPEAAALAEVLKALKAHPAVSWCERQNSGAVRSGGRFIRFGWAGCSDLIGMMRDGRFMAVEVKAPKGRLRPEQAVFLDRVRAGGGVGFVARDLRDVVAALGPL